MRYSKHAVERFRERFPNRCFQDQSDLVSIHNDFKRAVENKTFIHNEKIMTYLAKRYGDCSHTFFENGNMMFIVKWNAIVVTVVDSSKFKN